MSELRAAAISNLAGTGPIVLTGQTAAKAWMNLTGTGTITVNASANTSSTIDNGTGDYSENFTVALSDTNYSPQVTAKRDDANGSLYGAIKGTAGAVATTAIRITTLNDTGTAVDALLACTTVTR